MYHEQIKKLLIKNIMLHDNLKALIQYILPKHALTRLAGYLANIKIPAIKNYLIRYFINKYDVNMNEAREENLGNYVNFNEFFIRQLKPECRPIAKNGIISPVDGFISEVGDIKAGTLLQAKGLDYSLHELLASHKDLSDKFNQGIFATLYLSPKDYHRVHMPISAKLTEMTYVPGNLFSVQPATARTIPKLFARNERLVVLFDTDVGPMAMVLVGATIVGAIGTTWHKDVVRSQKPCHFSYNGEKDAHIFLQRAEEMGYFKLGSTVILLFADKSRVKWLETLRSGDKIKFGEDLGVLS